MLFGKPIQKLYFERDKAHLIILFSSCPSVLVNTMYSILYVLNVGKDFIVTRTKFSKLNHTTFYSLSLQIDIILCA